MCVSVSLCVKNPAKAKAEILLGYTGDNSGLESVDRSTCCQRFTCCEWKYDKYAAAAAQRQQQQRSYNATATRRHFEFLSQQWAATSARERLWWESKRERERESASALIECVSLCVPAGGVLAQVHKYMYVCVCMWMPAPICVYVCLPVQVCACVCLCFYCTCAVERRQVAGQFDWFCCCCSACQVAQFGQVDGASVVLKWL